MSYVRSALTYGAIFYLIGLLLLFFGGLLLSGGATPPGRGAGWPGFPPSAAPTGVGLFLAALCTGVLVAGWARASWEETAVILVICAGGLWVLSPDGMEEVWRLLWQVSWLWEGAVDGRPGPGWASSVSVSTQFWTEKASAGTKGQKRRGSSAQAGGPFLEGPLLTREPQALPSDGRGRGSTP